MRNPLTSSVPEHEKWIEDLPADFSQDFQFSLFGVDSPHEVLTKELNIGERNWGEVVTLTRDAILDCRYVGDCLRLADIGVETIQCSFSKAQILGPSFDAVFHGSIGDVIRFIQFNGQDIDSVPDLSRFPGLISLNFSGCKALQDVSGLSGLTGLTSLDLSFCHALQDLSGLSGLTGLTSLNLMLCTALIDVSELSNLTALVSLDLNNCHELKKLPELSELKGLTFLNLERCYALQDLSGLSGLTSLIRLNLTECSALEDVSALSGLTSLIRLNLTDCSALEDVSALSELTGLTDLKMGGCNSVQDVSMLAELSALSELRLYDCPLIDHERNWEAISKLGQLRVLNGFREPILKKILWNAARSRGDLETLHNMFPQLLKLCGNSHLEVQALKVCLLEALEQMDLSADQWKSLDLPFWQASEWSVLWKSMLEAKRPEASSMLQTKLELGEQVAGAMSEVVLGVHEGTSLSADLHGWLLLLADGGDWAESTEWLSSMVVWLPLSELHSAGPDLLMALRVVGLRELENEVLGRLTQVQGDTWVEQVEHRLACAAVDAGNIGQAIQSIGQLPIEMADAVRSDLIARWAREMPEEVAGWMSGFHKEATREQAAFRLASSDGNVATSTARHLVLMDVVASRQAMLPFIESMASALPEDPWVKALLVEVGAGDSSMSQEVLEAMGLEILRQDEEVREEVGDRKLRKLIEARGQEAAAVRERARQAALNLLRREDLID